MDPTLAASRSGRKVNCPAAPESCFLRFQLGGKYIALPVRTLSSSMTRPERDRVLSGL